MGMGRTTRILVTGIIVLWMMALTIPILTEMGPTRLQMMIQGGTRIGRLTAAATSDAHAAFLTIPHATIRGAPLLLPFDPAQGDARIAVQAANTSHLPSALAYCHARPDDCTGLWGTGTYVGAEEYQLDSDYARRELLIPAPLATVTRPFPFHLAKHSVHAPAFLARLLARCTELSPATRASSLSKDPDKGLIQAVYGNTPKSPDRPTGTAILSLLTPLDPATHLQRVRSVVASLSKSPHHTPKVLAITLTIFNRADQLQAWARALHSLIPSRPSSLTIAVCAAHYGGALPHTLPLFSQYPHGHVLDLDPPFSRAGGMQACLDFFLDTYTQQARGASHITILHTDVDVHLSHAYLDAATSIPIPGAAFLIPVSDFDLQLAQSFGLSGIVASDIVAAGGYRPEVFKGYNCEDTDLVHRLSTSPGSLIPLRHTVKRMHHIPHSRDGVWYKGKNARSHLDCGDLALDVTLRTLSSDLVHLCLKARV